VTGQALVRGGGRELEEKIGSLAGWPASLTSLGWVNREGLVLFLNLLGGLLALPVMPQLLALQTVVHLAVGARGTATCLGLWGRGALGLCAEQALVPPRMREERKKGEMEKREEKRYEDHLKVKTRLQPGSGN